jgi:hypothetical protein
MKWILELSAVIAIAVLLDKSLPAQAPQTQTWFTAKSGATTCTVKKVFQTPIKFSWVCSNSFGSVSGSYSANASDPNAPGANYFYVGMNSITAPPTNPQADTNLSCLIQVNGTAAPLMMLNGLMIDANSAAYSCTNFSASGNGSISWP